jgi:hypothetical protein
MFPQPVPITAATAVIVAASLNRPPIDYLKSHYVELATTAERSFNCDARFSLQVHA